jgi:hypothetical protein|tara:strand:+ start:6 stop:1133 length:1128 start_codon:yes stop_codon:yes gene_type:complete
MSDLRDEKSTDIQEDKISDIYNDVIKVEESKDYLNLNHRSEKSEINFNLSVKERHLVSDLISKKHPFSSVTNSLKKSITLSENESKETVAKQLNEKGFYVLENRLSEDVCEKIKTELEKVPYEIRGFKKDLTGINENNISKYKSNVLWVKDINSVLKIPEIQNIAFDDRLLNIVGEFLGSIPILTITSSWWSKNHSNHRSNLSGNAQMYHQDLDYIKFLKVFIYLNDIEEENGPHKYVQGSAKTTEDKLGDRYKMNTRLDESTVKNLFGEDNIVTFTGKKGTIIIEDTLGLHRGTPVIKGSRLLVQLQYTNSLYFHSNQFFDPKFLLPEVKEMKIEHPRVFLNFNSNAKILNKEKKEKIKLSLKQKLIYGIRKFI